MFESHILTLKHFHAVYFWSEVEAKKYFVILFLRKHNQKEPELAVEVLSLTDEAPVSGQARDRKCYKGQLGTWHHLFSRLIKIISVPPFTHEHIPFSKSFMVTHWLGGPTGTSNIEWF